MLGDAAAARRLLDEAEERRHPFLPVLDFESTCARLAARRRRAHPGVAVEACRRGAARCREPGAAPPRCSCARPRCASATASRPSRLADLAGSSHPAGRSSPRRTPPRWPSSDPERLLSVARAGSRRPGCCSRPPTPRRSRRRSHGRGSGSSSPREAEDRARELAGRAEDACTPALREAETPALLSAREREVAVLAGEGLTNRQIAERLHVSVRTVESHVYRACSRLGLSDRAALVAVAGVRRPRG